LLTIDLIKLNQLFSHSGGSTALSVLGWGPERCDLGRVDFTDCFKL